MASAPVFAAQRGRLFLKLQKITFDKLVSIEALKAFLVLRKKEKIQSQKYFRWRRFISDCDQIKSKLELPKIIFENISKRNFFSGTKDEPFTAHDIRRASAPVRIPGQPVPPAWQVWPEERLGDRWGVGCQWLTPKRDLQYRRHLLLQQAQVKFVSC